MGLFGLRSGWYAKEPNHGVRSPVEDVDAGQEQIVEKPHKRSHEQGSPLRPGDGHALGRELSKDYVQEGNCPESNREGDDVDAPLQDAQRLQDGLQDMGEGWL